MSRWLVLGTALLATSLTGCGGVEVDADGDLDDDVAAESEVRISSRFEVTIPAADAWAGITDLNTNVPGIQVNVEVHKLFSRNRRWRNHGNELWESYRVITTGQENPRGNPRTLATSNSGSFRAVDGAFTLNGALYLLGRATGGSRNTRGVGGDVLSDTRNEKAVVIGITFNGRASADRLNTAANVTEGNYLTLDGATFAPSSGNVTLDVISFSQRWADIPDNDPFACYNLNNPGGQFLTGTSPTDFRSPAGGFVLNGSLYVVGQATGGATAVAGRPGYYTANAPRRALASYGSGAAGTPVNFNVTVTTLPNAI